MVEIDVSEVLDLSSRAVRELRRFDDRMYGIVQDFVAREQSGHRYQNRTHMAETHTNAVRVGDGEVRAEMAVPYASYLQRGQWSKFETLMGMAEARVNRLAFDTAAKTAR
jgi:hypothetical protein